MAHWVDRYGIAEVREWFFEVWNEPNLKAFWTKRQADYFKFYRITVEAIKSVDTSLQVGGPATAKNEWIAEFVDFCARKNFPADFISTHHYPTDALGNEGDDTLTQLANSRRSILREQAQDTFRRARGKPIYYTEWNASSNPRDPLHDEPYTAAFIVKTILETNGLVEGYSFWTFSDIFEENYFPSIPFHGGFGLLNLHGIPKPSYRAFELLHRLGTEQLLVDGIHATVDAWVIPQGKKLTVMLTNYALPRHSIETEQVWVRLAEAARPRAVFVERTDETFEPYVWEGYSEALILYILGLAAPDFPLPAESYAAWTSTYEWKTLCGLEFLYAGPLFIHQLSHIWIDFRGIQDELMRGKGITYFENSRRATYVQQAYAMRNPNKFIGYGKYGWGVTTSDGPGPATRKINGVARKFFDYAARGIPDGPDDGTIAPWAMLASLPFAPEIVLPSIKYFDDTYPEMASKYGFKCSYNPTFTSRSKGRKSGWISQGYYGLDQGPIVMMIENYRSGFLWRLMRDSPEIKRGLRRAGFSNGWLESK